MSPARRPAATAVTALSDPAAALRVDAACRTLALPTVRAEAGRIAAAAARERLSHGAFLAEVPTAECDDRDARRRVRLVREAKFPRAKRLTDFDLTALPDLPPATLAELADGAWIDAGEPVVLLGDSGTGKTHLLIALGTAAAESGRRVRYITTAALVNELAEAVDGKQLSRVVGRYSRLDLLCLDEVGYVHGLAVHPARSATVRKPPPSSQPRSTSRTSITSTSRNAIASYLHARTQDMKIEQASPTAPRHDTPGGPITGRTVVP